jgi:hypothetical protein
LKCILFNKTGSANELLKESCRTSDHIYILKTLINKYSNKCKNNLYVCFVDFKKVFDSAVRQALMYKLL